MIFKRFMHVHAHKMSKRARARARIFTKINLVDSNYLKSLSIKFHKDPSFRWGDIQLLVTIWSTSKDISDVHLELIVKHSIWQQRSTIWSTPYDSNSRPYGVLHRALKTSLMELFIFLPQLTYMTLLWSTPYGLKSLSYGVLHMASKSNHMEYSIWQYI